MQTLPRSACLLLCAIVSFADAAHYHHSHRRPSGYLSGFPSPGNPVSIGPGSLLPPSGASSGAPYPTGNGTFGGSTSTGTGSISTTITTIIQSTIYVPAPTAPGSPEPTESIGGPAEAASSGLRAAGSENTSADSGEGTSSCESPATVTITHDTTVTVTASESQTLVPARGLSHLQSVPHSQASAESSYPVVQRSSTPAIAASSIVSDFTSAKVVYSTPVSSGSSSESRTSPTAATPYSTSVAASSNSLSSAASGSRQSLTPNGIKAGVAGYQSITNKAAWTQFAPHIGWYSDYWPNTPDSGTVSGVGMLWGDGHLGGDDAKRLAAFNGLTTTPKYMMGFFEPDFTPPDSSDISSISAASTWSSLIAPLGAKGTLLGSPSLAKQKDESWLTPFANAPEHPTWNYTCIHTNKPNVTGVKEDVEYYLAKYKKPIWVSEFACVDDKTWTPCTDPAEIKSFIQDVVAFLQGNENVVAYGYSNGDGLGTAWPMIDKSGAITASGQVYLDTISAL